MDRKDSLAKHGIIIKDNFGLFFGGVLSNWYKSPFTLHGIDFCCVEQYFMARKAITFHDSEMLERIMTTDNPSAHKAYGRQVKGYDDNLWNAMRYPIIKEGLFAKFDQNMKLGNILLETGHLILVETSPYDSIFGIKMSMNDPNVINPALWQGKNLLGMALMDIRTTIADAMDYD